MCTVIICRLCPGLRMRAGYRSIRIRARARVHVRAIMINRDRDLNSIAIEVRDIDLDRRAIEVRELVAIDINIRPWQIRAHMANL